MITHSISCIIHKRGAIMDEVEQYLRQYAKSGMYPFHMPGHKRNTAMLKMDNPYEIDVTEVLGTDNLHHAEGILKKSMERAARCFHADKTYYLINGSSGGILAAVSACVKRGDTVLMARNCHKSVYHACLVNGVKQAYVYPKFTDEGIAKPLSVRLIECAIRQSKPKCLVITSPTYEGVISPISEIAQLAHRYGVTLIVDEAHGAHLGFHSYFPNSAITQQADIVIQSMHKTLPAMTQTSLLHVNECFANRDKLEFYLRLYQTSSPSYILMSSMDTCVNYLLTKGQEEFSEYANRLIKLDEQLNELTHLKRFSYSGSDPSKVVILTNKTNLSGIELASKLRERKIESEMAERDYVILMTSVCDTDEAFEWLGKQLIEIDQQCKTAKKKKVVALPTTKAVMTAEEAFQADYGVKLVSEAVPGEVVKEYAYIYPPGMPLIVPGELMTEQISDLMKDYEAQGFTIEN